MSERIDTMMPSRFSTLVIMIGISWLSATPVMGQSAAAAPGAQTDAIVRVNVDLAARAFDRVLPFDVPFFIVGVPPERTETLRVAYREISKDGSPTGPWTSPLGSEWKATNAVTADTRFAVLLRRPLEAERYYEFVFQFRKAPDQSFTSDFRKASREVVDSRLQSLPGTALSLKDALGLRQRVVERVQARTKDLNAEWEPRAHSLFDLNDTSSAALTAFINAANGVLGPQDDRQRLLASFAEVQPRLSKNAITIHQQADLRTFVAGAEKLTTALMQALLKADAEGVGFISLSPETVRLMALGGTDTALGDIWSADDVRTRVTVYEQLLRRFTQLRHFVQTTTDPNGLGPEVAKLVGATVFNNAAAFAGPNTAFQAGIDDAFRAVNDAKRLVADLDSREASLVALIDRLAVLLLDERFVEGTTVSTGQTAQSNYISADGGMLYAGIGVAALYVGSNFYFRPVNKDAPLSLVSSFSRRFAVTVGLTVSSVADEGNRRRKDLFANQSLVLGAGYRVSPSIRVGGGALIYRKANDNPLISEKDPWPTWYVSFSFDLDVARGIKGLGGQFPQQ